MSFIKSVFSKLQRSLVLKTSIVSLLLIMSFSIPNAFNAYADISCNSSIVNLQDSSYRGPVYLDSYWTDQSSSSTATGNPLKKEIGPGEGPSTLAVVMVNRSPNDIIDVTGVLNLPPGFAPTGTSGDPSAQNIFKATLRTGANNPALASYDNTITNGSTFTLYFDINVPDKVKVGLYPTLLVINYYTAGDFTLCNSALLTVPFTLPGKVILDAVPITTSIPPNQPSTVNISIENKGSADATGVVVSILGLGQSKTTGSSSSSSSLVLQSSQTQLVNLGANMFNIGTIPAHGKTIISTSVYPSSSASGSTQDVQLQLSYGNAYGYKLSSTISTGLVISPDNNTPTLNISSNDKNNSPLLTAGKLDDLNFTVTNNGANALSNIVISLTPPSSSLSIVGDSKWTIQNMNPGDTKKLSTKVFAATSVIDTPTSFSVIANYISNGVAKTDSLNLGAYVVGDINIVANDISVNYIGNTANIVGNLLNQGSTTGLFTSIQLLHPESLVSPVQDNGSAGNDQLTSYAQGDNAPSSQGGNVPYSHKNNTANSTPQYIGDLTANSPTPFSIPLVGAIQPGVHHVSFKVAYADDLKHFHELTIDRILNVQQSPSSSTHIRHDTGFGGGMLLYLPITGVSAVIATIFVMRKRNSSKKTPALRNKKDIDIESLLDNSPSEKNDKD